VHFELFRARALGERPAGVALARRVATAVAREALATLDEPTLWTAHADGMRRWRELVASGGDVAVAASAPTAPRSAEADLLALKVELGRRLLGPHCRVCWLGCPVDRRAGPAGRCGLGPGLRVYRDYVHLGEELEVVPTHALFLAGCNYRCAYCSDWTHVDRPLQHKETPASDVARSIDARRAEGARTLTFVGGDPDVNLPGILEALAATTCSTPVVWNANLSGTPEAHDLLEGVVDAWVADLKYGSEACARPGSAVPDSLAPVHANLRRAAGEAYTVVRHLLLPGHVECCALPVLEWLAGNVPGARVNLMGQFEPIPEVRGTAWDRLPTASELERARARALALGLDLHGPGPLPAQTALANQRHAAGRSTGPTGVASAAPPLETTIRLKPGGAVVFEDLPPELLALAAELGIDTDELGLRQAAAAPWTPPPGS
jgi:putative pyruvate formate lyase activating enzyme